VPYVVMSHQTASQPPCSPLRRMPPRPRTRHRPRRVPDAVDPSTSAAAEQAARDEELRGECARAFACSKKGNHKQATQLLEKLLARHPAHPLLRYAHARLAHKLLLEQRDLAGILTQFRQCFTRVSAPSQADNAPASLLLSLLIVQASCDSHAPSDQAVQGLIELVRDTTNDATEAPLNAADFQYAKAMTTFDDGVLSLPMFPDVRECADSAVPVRGRGLDSSTFQLNLSALYGIGGARRGCTARVKGVLGGVQGVKGVLS
jgi:tetratricopeptide (TPR) repeat protein